MSFENPTSEVYFLSVPFSTDLKNVVDFPNANVQETTFKQMSGKHFTNLNIIRKDRPLVINGDFGDYQLYNYMMFRNPELSSKWWYAFIVDSNYSTNGDTEITFEIDPWQTFLFNTKFNYRCMIERGMPIYDNDDYHSFTQPEPFSVEPTNDYSIDDSLQTADWNYSFLVETASYPLVTIGEATSFQYGGSGQSSLFGWKINTSTWQTGYTKLLKLYEPTLIETLFQGVDHRNDIKHIRVVPSWSLVNQSTNPEYSYTGMSLLDSNNIGVVNLGALHIPKKHYSNEAQTKVRNNKVLGSCGRIIKIINRAGTLDVTLKPEECNYDAITFPDENLITLHLNGAPIGMEHYRLLIDGYRLDVDKYKWIPYNCVFEGAYETMSSSVRASAGLTSAVNVLGGGLKLASGGVTLSSGLGSNPTYDTKSWIEEGSTGLNWYNQTSKGSGVNTLKTISGLGMVGSGASDIFNGTAGLMFAESGSITGGNSTGVDLTSLSSENQRIRAFEVVPSMRDIHALDDFFDQYGYSLNQTGTLSYYMNTRDRWNYIKTSNCNIKLNGSAIYEEQLKSMFNKGVTIWHDINTFGIYNEHGSEVQLNKSEHLK